MAFRGRAARANGTTPGMPNMPNSSQRSISKDLTIGLILVVMIVSSIALLLAYNNSRKKAEAELQTKADEYTAFIKDTLVPPLWNYDFETINAVCRTYLQNDLITGVEVNDLRGQVNINMFKDNVKPAVVRTVELSRHEVPIGQVRISLTYGYLTQWNRQLFWSFAMVILINLVTLVVLTGIMLRMSLKRPLNRLNEIVDSYAAGEYHSFSRDIPHSELRPLVDTLDQMGRKIQVHLSTIQKAEKKFRSIFENAIEGIYQSTPDGRILSANPAFAKIIGYNSPERMIAEIEDIGRHHWLIPEERKNLVNAILENQSVTGYEARMVRNDGKVIWLLINGQAVYDSAGNLRYLEGMVQDITHRKEAESELRRHSTAVEQVADSIYLTDDKGRIDYVNPAFEKITGYSRSEIIGKRPAILGADRRESALYGDIWNAITMGEVWTGRIKNAAKSGEAFIVDATVSPIKSRSGRFIGCAAVSRDITEKERFENQIRQTQKMEAIGTLAGGIAHDFNNMLGVIIGCSELAMDGIPEDGLPKADMERVLDAGLRAKSLVRQILTFSRQSESERKPLLLNPFLKEVVKFLRATLPATIEVKLSLEAGNPTVLADPTQLQQILLNLCTNSAHALESDGGLIEVTLSGLTVDTGDQSETQDLRPGSYINLEVRDNGGGIPEEHIHRIFDPFFTTKSVGEGTGLGLSVVHGIVNTHGGTVRVSSEPGRGTAIQVFLPSIDHPGFEPEPESTMPPPEGDENILLVEDEPVLADILDRILSGLGYQVKRFSESGKALQYFEADPDRFDLALLDHNMPEITGLELIERFKERRGDLSVILYTGMNIEPLRREAEKAGRKRNHQQTP